MRESRRNVLKAGAGLATTGVLTSLAGCSQVPVVGDVLGGGAHYQDELYEPGTVSGRNHYRFTAMRPSEMLENEREFSRQSFEEFEQFVEETLFRQHGLRITDIETLTIVDAGSVTMVTGEYATEDVVRDLEGANFDFERETDSGHQILINTNQPACAAVGDQSIVTLHSATALEAGDPVQVTSGTGTPAGVGREVDRDVQDLRSIQYGESVRSRIDPNDPQGERGWFEPVTFQGTQGDLVDITMESGPGDPFLVLEDPSGDVVAQNDDTENRNARISHELASSGQYRIVATGFFDDSTFPYVLTVEGQSVTADLRSISYGETRTGRIDQDDPTNDLGFHEPVTFQGSEGDVVTVGISGSQNAFVRLQDPNGVTVREQPGGFSNYTLESSGEYTIIATSQRPDETFVYNLDLRLEFSPDQMVTAVENILGAQSGETPRYVEAVEAANDLASAIGGGTIVTGLTTDPIQRDDPAIGLIENTVATGYSIQVQGRDSDYTAAAVFETQRDVRPRDVETWVESHSELGEATELEEAEQGRVGVVTGVIPTRDLGGTQ